MQQLCSKHAARVVQRTPRQALHLAHLLAPVVSRAATGDRQMSPANSTHGSCSTAERNAPADSRAGDLDHGVRGVSHEWHWHLSHLHLWPGGSVIYSEGSGGCHVLLSFAGVLVPVLLTLRPCPTPCSTHAPSACPAKSLPSSDACHPACLQACRQATQGGAAAALPC